MARTSRLEAIETDTAPAADSASTQRWAMPDGGLEHVAIKSSATNIVAEGIVVGAAGGGYGLRYRLTLEPGWTGWRGLHLTVLGGATVALRTDGLGSWSDASGLVRHDLAGVVDVEIFATPLPILATLRRMTWRVGKVQEFDIAAFTGPNLDVSRGFRRITCLEAGRRYHIEGADGAGSELRLDENHRILGWEGRADLIA
jgi:hypothetical protein